MKGYIYYIINKQNKKRYIGKTINLKHRLEQHYNDLIHNKHHSNKLQRAFNEYGWDSFEIQWKEIELESEDKLNELEIKEIEKYDSYKNGYNETLGGDGNKTALDWKTSVLIYHICQNYKGVNRKIAKYYNCDHSVIDDLSKNLLFAQSNYDKEEYKKLVQQLELTDNNLIENYIAHNEKKLDKQQCFELLSITKFSDKYEKTMCECLGVNNKLSWRLKKGLIYKDYYEEFFKKTYFEQEDIYKKTLVKYNIINEYSIRQRKGVKNPLTQEQVNYILDNKNVKSKAAIARDLNISVDRVNSICSGRSYKDLIFNYYSSKE